MRAAASADRRVQAPGVAARRISGWLARPAAKPIIFALCLLPLAWLFWAAWADALGANPAEALIRGLGDWSLRMLCITLAVTPLREATGIAALARLRRMFGLFTYFYVCLHLLAYAWLDMGLELGQILPDIAKRPFILVGTLTWLLLSALAATSFDRAIRALGARRWRRLHRLVYVIAGLALLHFFWMRSGKNDYAEVAVYAVIIALLLGWRVFAALKRRR